MLGANKLRGTKRLKYFCQLCTKQCKDEHGWACHLNSGSHKRKVQEFAQNPQETIQKYSQRFQTNILQILRDRYPGVKVRLGELFRQFIDDRTYVDINMTYWKSLDKFGEYLKGVKNVQFDGSFVLWKQHQPTQAIVKAKVQKAKIQKQKQEQLDWKLGQKQKFYDKMLNKQSGVTNIKFQKQEQVQQAPQKIQFNLIIQQPKVIKKNSIFAQDQYQEQIEQQPIMKKNVNNLQKIAKGFLSRPEEQVQIQNNQEQKEYQWIMPGIQVKIIPHDIDQRFHNKKASITKVPQSYVAQLICDGVTLQIDQTYLQTVIPKPENQVMILVGKYRGQKAILQKINSEEGFGLLSLNDQGLRLSCDQICKLS